MKMAMHLDQCHGVDGTMGTTVPSLWELFHPYFEGLRPSFFMGFWGPKVFFDTTNSRGVILKQEWSISNVKYIVKGCSMFWEVL